MIQFIAAQPQHLAQIFALEKQTFTTTAWSEQAIAEELTGQHRNYFVVTDENAEIIGYGGVLVLGSDADIQTIAIAAEKRGSGLGRKLLNLLLDTAEQAGAQKTFLEVRADNPRAITLYENVGFETIATRKAYYQPEGVDALVMQLKHSNRKGTGK